MLWQKIEKKHLNSKDEILKNDEVIKTNFGRTGIGKNDDSRRNFDFK